MLHSVCKQKHCIRMKPDTLETMNTPQPDTISINGVEIPSWQKMWREQMILRKQITVNRWIVAIQSAVIFLIVAIELVQ